MSYEPGSTVVGYPIFWNFVAAVLEILTHRSSGGGAAEPLLPSQAWGGWAHGMTSARKNEGEESTGLGTGFCLPLEPSSPTLYQIPSR